MTLTCFFALWPDVHAKRALPKGTARFHFKVQMCKESPLEILVSALSSFDGSDGGWLALCPPWEHLSLVGFWAVVQDFHSGQQVSQSDSNSDMRNQFSLAHRLDKRE